MSEGEPDATLWRQITDAVDLATFSELARALEDTCNLPEEHACAFVDALIEDGILVECESSAMFTEYVVDEAANRTEKDDVLQAFTYVIEYFHNQLDAKRACRDGQITTARKYFEDERGWTPEIVGRARLGWAPTDETALRNPLQRQGFDDDAIRGTGLFTEDLRPLWRVHYVFPYFDADDRPVYAISRTADHAADWFQEQKYAKTIKTRDYSEVDEPIYGLETIREGEPVLVTEGIADTITTHENRYPCVSPVTTQFKHDDRERLIDILEERDVLRVYVVQDAEYPTVDVNIQNELPVKQFGEGLRGAVATVAYLANHGIDTRIGEVLQPDAEKVDLDDYLCNWNDDLTPILASAKPADHHPAYDPKEIAIDAAAREYDVNELNPVDGSDGAQSALFDLGIHDVTGLSRDYRGINPLGHHGDRENYFILIDERGVAYDHKYKVAYNTLTYLLCGASERSLQARMGHSTTARFSPRGTTPSATG